MKIAQIMAEDESVLTPLQQAERDAHAAYHAEPNRANLERVWAIQNQLYPREPDVPAPPEDGYRGHHEAPSAAVDDGCPMWNAFVNGIYPEDFYTNGYQYGDGSADDNMVIGQMQRLHNRPNALVWIYRAIPKSTPRGTKINRGDWVTTNARYAREHGRTNLRNEFRVIKMLVKARDIFTDGNSVQEWGYDPQPRVQMPRPEDVPS